MGTIEILTLDSDNAVPVLQDAIARHIRLLAQRTAHTQARIQAFASRLPIDLDRDDHATGPAARGLPTCPSHKPAPSGLLAAGRPALEQVLRDIVSRLNVP